MKVYSYAVNQIIPKRMGKLLNIDYAKTTIYVVSNSRSKNIKILFQFRYWLYLLPR